MYAYEGDLNDFFEKFMKVKQNVKNTTDVCFL